MNHLLTKLNNERTWLALLFVGGLLWIFVTFFSYLSFPDSSYNFIGTTNKVKLDPGAPVTQTFTATENNLNQIKVVFGNATITKKETVVFELADAACTHPLAQNTHRPYDSSPFIYYRLSFPAIPDSLGQTYCLVVTYFSPYDRGSDRPSLGASAGEQFTGLSYTNTGNGRTYENRTLQMRPSYGSGSLYGDLGRLNDRLSQYKPGFLKGPFLTGIFALFFLGTFALVYALIFRKNEE